LRSRSNAPNDEALHGSRVGEEQKHKNSRSMPAKDRKPNLQARRVIKKRTLTRGRSTAPDGRKTDGNGSTRILTKGSIIRRRVGDSSKLTELTFGKVCKLHGSNDCAIRKSWYFCFPGRPIHCISTRAKRRISADPARKTSGSTLLLPLKERGVQLSEGSGELKVVGRQSHCRF